MLEKKKKEDNKLKMVSTVLSSLVLISQLRGLTVFLCSIEAKVFLVTHRIEAGTLDRIWMTE